MKKYLSLVLIMSLLFALGGCSSSAEKLTQIQKNQTLSVYTDPNFPPFEFKGASGIEGVDIEIAKAIAEDLGVKIDIQEGKFDSIIMALKGGKGDIAISGFTITDERKESVDFSDPYINSVQYLILLDGSPIKIMEDLAGKKIGVAKGYTGSLLIDDEINKGVLQGTGASFTEYPSAMEATLDLKNKKVDAVVMDEYVAKNIVSKNTGLIELGLKYANGDIASEEYGVVVPKGNPELLARINTVIAELKSEDKIKDWVVKFAEV